MRFILLLSLSLLANAATAGWDTNAWPAWEHTRSGSQWVEDCTNAVNERYSVMGDSSVPRVVLPRPTTSSGNLRTLKSWMVSFVTYAYICDTAQTNGSGLLDDWYDSNPGSDHPLLGIAQICTNANLPSNFFTYTPERNLSGLGSFANGADFSVIGHKHGWTNTTTAAGGTGTLPPSRTEWYTTDYGWDGLRKAINTIVWNISGYDTDGLDVGYTNAAYYFQEDDSTNSWSDAKDEVIAAWPPSSTDSMGYIYNETEGYLNPGGDNWDAAAYSGIIAAKFDMIQVHPWDNPARTTLVSEADFYWRGDVFCHGGPSTFDQGSSTIKSNVYSCFHEYPASTDQVRETDDMGASIIFDPWVDEPSAGVTRSVRGWSWDTFRDTVVVTKWDVTNGFEYVDNEVD